MASAYNAQFEGLTFSSMPDAVWKNWAPPKCKLFVWLILQNRVWTSDRLQRRGWPNCGRCQLCNREAETGPHLFFKCRYTLRIWNEVISWLGLSTIDTSLWASFALVKEWRDSVIFTNGIRREYLASLIMLVSWEIWNEQNTWVFQKVYTMPTVVTSQVKTEAAL